MKETFTAKVARIEPAEDKRRLRYFFEYEKDGQTVEAYFDQGYDCIAEQGDDVLITVEDGRIVETSMAEATRKRNRLMRLMLLAFIAVIIGIILLFIFIDNLVFRIVLGVVVAAVIIILNVL